VTAKPMMMRAETSMQSAINWSLRGGLVSRILAQSLAETPPCRYLRASSLTPTAEHPPLRAHQRHGE
jgi:hypothetical protein